jgi:tetratricopeptide (TPR) repeat protein
MLHLLVILAVVMQYPVIAEVRFLKGPLRDATTKADAERKPVMIDFITDWCRWCDTLDLHTYSNEKVAEFINSNLVPIKIDAEKGEGIAIAKKYGVAAYPTIIVIKANGEEIDRILGYVPAEPFLKTITDYVDGRNTISTLQADLERKPDDASLQYALGEKYQDRNDATKAAEHFQRVLALDPNNTLGHNEEAQYAVALSTFRSSKDPIQLITFVDKYPKSEMVRQALSTIWRSYIKAKDGENARKYFLKTMEILPNDAGLMNNYAWGCAEQKINLDHASEVAQKAVALATKDGDRASYLDTYATVEFARGSVEKAVALEQQALDLLKDASPKTRKSYEESMAKFKAGLTSTKLKQ